MGLFAWFLSLFKKKPKPSPVTDETDIMPPPIAVSTGGKKVNKYANLNGVNVYAEPGNDLNGCVNDCTNMYNRLTTKKSFVADNVRAIFDKRSTQDAMLDHLRWITTIPISGDVAVWDYSGHGSQVRCRNGDELDDGMDEILCPHDMDWNDPFTDDMIASYLKNIKEGVKFVFISDSCHSGTNNRGAMGPNNPHPAKNRFLAPPLDIQLRGNHEIAGTKNLRDLPVRRIGIKKGLKRSSSNVTFLNQNHIHLSGCRDNQTSADAYIGGNYQGAMTASMWIALDRNPASWIEMHEMMLEWLHKNNYEQIPQLSGPEDLLRGPVFI